MFVRTFSATTSIDGIGLASYEAIEHVPPSTSINFIFSVHLEAAQSLTVLFCDLHVSEASVTTLVVTSGERH